MAWDHPRIRGEHHDLLPPRPHDAGSSPHTRGALQSAAKTDGGRRIIPAYAGSTTKCSKNRWRKTDHPRIRGEHSTAPTSATKRAGSSPHTRGALVPARHVPQGERIIPAYAGSTCLRPGDIQPYGDHPRIRGEHFAPSISRRAASGSSPHTRGARRSSRASMAA